MATSPANKKLNLNREPNYSNNSNMVKPIYLLSTPAFVYSLPIDLTKTTLPYNEFTTGPFLMSFTSGLRDFIYGTTLNMCAIQCAVSSSVEVAAKCTHKCFIKNELDSAKNSLSNVRRVLETSKLPPTPVPLQPAPETNSAPQSSLLVTPTIRLLFQSETK